MILLLFITILLISTSIHQVVSQMDEAMVPFGLNPPRQNPEYCVGMMNYFCHCLYMKSKIKDKI